MNILFVLFRLLFMSFVVVFMPLFVLFRDYWSYLAHYSNLVHLVLYNLFCFISQLL